MATTSDNLTIPLDPLEQDKKDELKEHLTQRRFSVTDQDISLHSLVELGEEWCLNLFLDFIESKENKHEYLEAPDCDGRTPLLTAVRYKHPEALKKLLDAGANINARDERGYGVLHHLVLKFSGGNPQTEEQQQQQEQEQEPLLRMLELLLSSRYVEILDLEPHGGLYRETPLEFAASRLKKGYESLGLYKLEDMLKKAVKQKKENHSLEAKMAKVVDLIIRDSSGDEVRKVLVGVKNNEGNELWKIANQKIGRYSLLFYAVDASNSSGVKVLLESGADPWKEESWARELPLHRAAARGNVEIFTMLLERMTVLKGNKSLEKYSYSLIKKLLENGNMKGKDVDHMKCFHLLLKKGVIQDVNQISSGKTPLRLAAEYNNEEMILGLLEAGAFLGARKDSEKDDRTIWDILPQGILQRAMDRLITQENKQEEEEEKKEEGKKLIRQETGNEKEEEVVKRKDYTLRLDYCFLLPPHQESDSNEPMKEMKTLMDMHDSGKHRDAIKHPLVKTLLQAKWSKAKRFHKIDLAFCFFFVGLLSVFAYLLKDLQESMQTTMYILKGLLGFFIVMMFVREGFQLKCRRIHYFKNFDNKLDLLLPVMVLVLIFTPENFSRHFAAWVIIAAWLQIMLTVGRAPYFTLYIKMLSCVFMNYLTLMPLFIFLITGFTLSLAVTNQHYYEHEGENGNLSFWAMFPKTISMSMGELDYSSLSEGFPTSVMARISAVFVFFAFVFGIVMVTMNVMNGLAVISTKEVKDEAELYKLISQLELIFMAEAFIQLCPRLGSFLGNTQFLSRSNNASCLLAGINKDPRELLLGTKEQEKGTRERLTKLDNDTADSLRYLRLQCLKEEKASKRLEEEKWLKLEESVKQINAMVRGLVNKLTPAQGAELHSEQ